MRHREREADRYRRVHGVAAFLQHGDADVGGDRLHRDDHAVPGVHRLARLDRRDEDDTENGEHELFHGLGTNVGFGPPRGLTTKRSRAGIFTFGSDAASMTASAGSRSLRDRRYAVSAYTSWSVSDPG